MHINHLPREIFLRIVNIVCNYDKPAPENNYGLEYVADIASVCRLWKALLPRNVTDTATIERVRIGECIGGRSKHNIEWMSNIKTIVSLEKTEQVKHLVIILDDKCFCPPHIGELLKLFRFRQFKWSGVRSIKFIGHGIFCVSSGLYDPDTDHRSRVLAKGIARRFPKLTSLEYNISRNDMVPWIFGHRNHPPVNSIFAQLHSELLGKLSSIMGAYPVVLPATLAFRVPLTSLLLKDEYLRTLPFTPKFPTCALRELRLICSSRGFPWDMFTTENMATIHFSCLQFLQICFGNTPWSPRPIMAADGGYDIRFPCLARVEISDSLRVYHDPLALFHSTPLHTLLLAEDMAALQRVNTSVLRNIRKLVFAVMSCSETPIRLPREAITRLYTARSNIQVAYMLGNQLPPPNMIMWSKLGRLILNLIPSEILKIERIIAQLPCLWFLRILHSNFAPPGKTPYLWEEEDGGHPAAIGTQGDEHPNDQAMGSDSESTHELHRAVTVAAAQIPGDKLPPLSTRLQVLEIESNRQDALVAICDIISRLPSLTKITVSDAFVAAVNEVVLDENRDIEVIGWGTQMSRAAADIP